MWRWIKRNSIKNSSDNREAHHGQTSIVEVWILVWGLYSLPPNTKKYSKDQFCLTAYMTDYIDIGR